MVTRILQRRGNNEPHEPGPRGDDHDLQSIRPSDYHQMSGAVPFEDGSAALTSASADMLKDIASHMRGLRLIIEVRGHASAAEAFHQPDKAMRLSFDRALAVANALCQQGVDWRQIRLIASGDNDRIRALAYDPDQQRPNQRVEVIVTDELIATVPPAKETPSATTQP